MEKGQLRDAFVILLLLEIAEEGKSGSASTTSVSIYIYTYTYIVDNGFSILLHENKYLSGRCYRSKYIPVYLDPS